MRRTQLRSWVGWQTVSIASAVAILVPESGQAFNPFSHQQITWSAFRYLHDHPTASRALKGWMNQNSSAQSLFERGLVRAVVDTDYRPDTWLQGSVLRPFAGAMSSNQATVFTTFHHHLNVRKPGRYWEYDGYAYANTDGSGNDGYLSLPTSKVRGDLSPTLGGVLPNGIHLHGVIPASYRYGFKGTNADWNRMFFGGAWAVNVVFPPSYVPAQLAFSAVMLSDRSQNTVTEEWRDAFPLIKTIFSTHELGRRSWRAETAGLPQAMHLLGMSLHLMQDLAVPHHTSAIAAYCHPELETEIDQLSVGSGRPPPYQDFDTGNYRDEDQSGQALYDPTLVKQMGIQLSVLRRDAAYSLEKRMKDLAKLTARWQWGDPEDSLDLIGTTLPAGTRVTGDYCREILADPDVKAQARWQYNLAVAATVAVLSHAADEFEKRHPQPMWLPQWTDWVMPVLPSLLLK